MKTFHRDIINSNINTLIANTICSISFLSQLLANNILSKEDVDEVDAIASNPTLQAYRFYRILVTRKDGFEALLKALEYTRQSSALTLLRKRSCDENDNTYLIPEDGPLLGKGSTGTSVHKGKFGNMDIAVKKMHVGIKSYEIEQELKVLKDCGGHENVVRYLGTRKIEQFVLIGLELCEMTLEKWVKEKSIHIPQLEVLKQITNGLDWLHRRDFLHRDLKPANILLTQTPARVKLSDFGLSRYIADGRNSVSSFNTGTDGWIAPEVLRRQQVSNVRQKLKFTRASDVFALGCVYYYVLSDGEHLFGNQQIRRNANIFDDKPVIDTSEIRHECLANLHFIKPLISSDPASRPSCTTVLCSPLYWSHEQQVCFLEDIRIECKNIFNKICNYKGIAECKAHSTSHIEAFVRRGLTMSPCVIPYAYFECQSFKNKLEKYYESGYVMQKFSSSKKCGNEVVIKILYMPILQYNQGRNDNTVVANQSNKMLADVKNNKSLESNENYELNNNVPSQVYCSNRLKVSVEISKPTSVVKAPTRIDVISDSTWSDLGRWGLFSPDVSDALNLSYSTS